jgi:hypothetical protein
MRKFFLTIILGAFTFYLYSQPSEVVKFDWVTQKEGTSILKISVPQGFGIQKEAPHSFLFSPSNDLKIQKADTKLVGPTDIKKPEYFEYVEPLVLKLEGKGSLQMNARVYYCDYNKGICIPGKFQKTFTVP